MAGHSTQITIKVANQIQGVMLKEEFADLIWPGATPAEIAEGLQQWIVEAVTERARAQTTQIVADWIDTNINEQN